MADVPTRHLRSDNYVFEKYSATGAEEGRNIVIIGADSPRSEASAEKRRPQSGGENPFARKQLLIDNDWEAKRDVHPSCVGRRIKFKKKKKRNQTKRT